MAYLVSELHVIGRNGHRRTSRKREEDNTVTLGGNRTRVLGEREAIRNGKALGTEPQKELTSPGSSFPQEEKRTGGTTAKTRHTKRREETVSRERQ